MACLPGPSTSAASARSGGGAWRWCGDIVWCVEMMWCVEMVWCMEIEWFSSFEWKQVIVNTACGVTRCTDVYIWVEMVRSRSAW